MDQSDSLTSLLQLPAESSAAVAAWLRTAVTHIKGFTTQPCIIRRAQANDGLQVDVRRWSTETFLPLAKPLPRKETLMLREDGILTLRYLDGTRCLRSQQDELLTDEIYHFQEIEEPTAEQLDTVRLKAIITLYPEFYALWERLSDEQRVSLISCAGRWQDISAVLERQEGNERVHTMQILLSCPTAPNLRQEIVQAGIDGLLRPGAAVLPWLLARPDWNLNAGLVAMSRNAVSDEPDAAWSLTTHPNTQVRLRLADLLTDRSRLLNWIACEPDENVRSRILLSVEQLCRPRDLVAILAHEKDRTHREMLGWALANWSTGITASEDWAAMNSALFAGIGKRNRSQLKEKLAQHNRLSLKARLLG